MKCADFERALPEIVDSSGTAEQQEHLHICSACAALIADLREIADQARLLPLEDPAPHVWEGIRASLQAEGLIQPAIRPALVTPRPWSFRPLSWQVTPWLAAAAAALLVVFGLMLYRQGNGTPAQTAATQPSITKSAPVATAAVSAARTPKHFSALPPGVTVQDDQQLLDQVSRRNPAMRATYEANLQHVNAYIQDASMTLEQNPDDVQAQQDLLRAYDQKNMMYELAPVSEQQ